MTAKFTNAPWSVEDPLGPEIISIVSGGPEVFHWRHIAQIPTEEDGIPAHEAEANARLIAAAPALYEALELLLADIQDYQAWQRPCHAVDVAIAALAKARGEPS